MKLFLRALAKWCHEKHRRWMGRSLIQSLLQLAWISAIVWLVWNHALSDFLGAGRMDLWKAVGIGVLVTMVAPVFRETPLQSALRMGVQRR